MKARTKLPHSVASPAVCHMALTLGLALLAFGCDSAESSSDTPDDVSLLTRLDTGGPVLVEGKTRVSFVINTHGWVLDAEMRAVVDWVLDVHELYQVPVDFYLTDPVVQRMEGLGVMNRLANSPWVSVSYFSRVPTPWKEGYDPNWIDTACAADDATQYEMINGYETHRLNLTNGRPSPMEAGGFDLLTSLLGSPPVGLGKLVGGCSPCMGSDCTTTYDSSSIPPALARWYYDHGAVFVAATSRASPTLGDTHDSGLFLRPEDASISLWESDGDDDDPREGWLEPQELLDRGWGWARDSACPPTDDGRLVVTCTAARYLNIKIHDDNFYADAPGCSTSFNHVYYDGCDKALPLTPPFDVVNAPSVVGLTMDTNPTRYQNLRDRYEGLVALVAANPDRYEVINLELLATEVGR